MYYDDLEEYEDQYWCSRCDRDAAFCACICYRCFLSLDEKGCQCSNPIEDGICKCKCIICHQPSPGAGLCNDCIPKWEESKQGPRPFRIGEVGTCKCSKRFNRTFAIKIEKPGFKEISHFGFHNDETLLDRCPVCLIAQWNESRQGPTPSMQKGREIDTCSKCKGLFNPYYEDVIVEAVEGVHGKYKTLQNVCPECRSWTYKLKFYLQKIFK